SEWLLHKPEGINQSVFWNTDFATGFGIAPSSLVTGGIIGFLGWLVFLLLFLYVGVRALVSFSLSRPARYLVVSSFMFAAYLWTFVVLYVPNTLLYVLAFLATGILVAALASENPSARYSLNLLGNPKLGFVSVLFLIFLLIGAAAFGYFFTEKFVSLFYFERSLAALNKEGSVEKTEEYLGKAINLSPSDLYYRAASELNLIKLNALLQQSSVPQDTLRAQFQTLLGAAIDSAKSATDLDKTNYANFLSLGRVYEAIVPLKIEGSYDAAKEAYQKALTLNPESPAILLGMARLEVAKGDNAAARKLIAQAIEKKSNYTEAVFFLAQLEAQEGNIRDAIAKTEEASLLAPNSS
ncbi:tetratricopeptide repeat protein, partial [Candidatus Parcubacteria bacterium]|nr:tetratricopeptide repeat protein [Candidatus Parcubacteria bacterium]